MFNTYDDSWPRRSTLGLVAFAVVVVEFTAFALTWSGFNGERNSASAIHTPRRKAQYPPAGPPTTHYGVLAGVAGQNYKPR